MIPIRDTWDVAEGSIVAGGVVETATRRRFRGDILPSSGYLGHVKMYCAACGGPTLFALVAKAGTSELPISERNVVAYCDHYKRGYRSVTTREGHVSTERSDIWCGTPHPSLLRTIVAALRLIEKKESPT